MAKVIDVHGKERRLDRRRDVLLDGRLDGHPVRILDVSFGGMKGAIEILGDDERLPTIGAQYPLELESDGFGSVRFAVTVVRVNMRKGTFGVHFDALDDNQYRHIERLVLGRSLAKV